jgi:alanyl-tRNA synthetase
LLQAALKSVLGNHVAQAGSYVDENRMRFDFSHFAAMTKEELSAVEKEINEKILADLKIDCSEKSLKEAKEMGATALFSEKYGETVRVVKMGDYSLELCGGTHAESTGKLGLFKILSESGVAAGVRRIEAVTGFGVLSLLDEKENLINDTASVLKSNPAGIVQKAQSLVDELKEANREIDSMKSKMASSAAGDVLDSAVDIDGISFVAQLMPENMDMNTLREVGDNLKQKCDNALIVLASVAGDKVNLIAMATKEAVANGAHSGKIVSELAKLMGGGGGGKPESAQAGGKDPSKAKEAMEKAGEIFKSIKG